MRTAIEAALEGMSEARQIAAQRLQGPRPNRGSRSLSSMLSVARLPPMTTLATALRLTRKHRIRHLPVVLGTRQVAGILSDRDIRLAKLYWLEYKASET